MPAPPVVAPMPVGPTYYGGTYAPAMVQDDARSQTGYMPGYGMRQTGNPTPPGTLHGFQPTYAQNPRPSLYNTGANPNKAVYYDEKEPDFTPNYGTQGYVGGRGLYGTGINNTGDMYRGNYY